MTESRNRPRSDGVITFFSQHLQRCETDGMEYFVWHSQALSGLYPDLTAAKHDAARLVLWLRDSNWGGGM